MIDKTPDAVVQLSCVGSVKGLEGEWKFVVGMKEQTERRSMKLWKCDYCGSEMRERPQIKIRGYHPDGGGRILLPEQAMEYEFCTRGCFVAWMRVENLKGGA